MGLAGIILALGLLMWLSLLAPAAALVAAAASGEPAPGIPRSRP